MSTFRLEESKRDNSNTKQKVFIEYLYEKFGVSNSEEFDNEYLTLLNEDDLIESLKYYISKNSVTAQVTAKNYITYLTKFFEKLSNEHNIVNEIFVNINLKTQFVEKTNVIISELKEKEDKDIATDEQYENLMAGIEKFLISHPDIETEVYCEFQKAKETGNDKLRIYPHFVSIIATELVLKLGLKALTIASLNLKSIDVQRAILYIHETPLPLDKELVKLLDTYLRIRKSIINRQSIIENMLFINYDGTPYQKTTKNRKHTTSYGMLFKIMKECVQTVSTEIFSARTAQQWLENGMSVSFVSKVTGFSPTKCIELQDKNDNNNLKKLPSLLSNKIEIKKKEQMACPFCGSEISVVNDDWTLVQFENTIFYISKKELYKLSQDSDIDVSDSSIITDDSQLLKIRFTQDMDEDIDIPENETVEQRTLRVKRYQYLVNRIKEIYGYKCQLCNDSFKMDNGNEYCEAHHIKLLSQGGSQDLQNVIIVCAKHHRMFHYARNSIIIGDLIAGKRSIKIGEDEFTIPFAVQS